MPGTDEHVEKLVDAAARRRRRRPEPRIPACASSSSARSRPPRRSPPRTRRTASESQLISYALMLIILLVAFGARRRRRPPARARRHRRRRHGRPARAGQPALRAAARRRRARRDHRPRRRRGLRDVLLAPDDGGARPRPLAPRPRCEIAAATSGRAVLISGMTVMTAMAGLLFAGNPIFVGFGIGTMLVVAVAMLGSLTFLPAMLSFLGQQELAREGPRALRHQAPPPGQGRVARLGRHPHPRPQAPARLDAASPAACSSPSASPRSASSSRSPGFDGYSRSQPVIQTYDRVQAAFPGGAVPAMTVIKAARRHGRAGPGRDRAAARPGAGHAASSPSPPASTISPDKTVAVVALSVKGSGTDAASERSLEVLRSEVVPATVGKLAGAEVAVTGVTAGSKDFIDVMTAHAPIVFAVRAQPRVHPAAGHVPLDRGADQGDRPQPAVGRRGLRRPRARLPGRSRREAARLPVGRRHRPLDPAVPVRDPVRPLDGLPRVHPQPRPRSRRPRA